MKTILLRYSRQWLMALLLGLQLSPTLLRAQCPATIADATFADAIRTLYPALIGPAGNNALTQAAASYTGVLDFSAWGTSGANAAKPKLTNVDGLVCFSSATEINLSNQQLTTLPTLPQGLITFKASNNQLTSLPALPPRLDFLDVGSNLITGLPTLPSVIRRLGLGNNRIAALSELPNSIVWISIPQQHSKAPALPLAEEDKLLTALPNPLPTNLQVLNVGENNLTALPALPASLVLLYINQNPNLVCLPTLPANFFNGSISSGYLAGKFLSEPRLRLSGAAVACLPNRPAGISTTKVSPAAYVAPDAQCSIPPTVSRAVPVCSTGNTGRLVVTATGGGTLEYSVDGTTFQTSNVLQNLASGNYTLTVRRQGSAAAGCPSASATVPVTVSACNTQTYYANFQTGSDATGDGTQVNPWKTVRYSLKKVPANQGNTLQLAAGTFEEDSILVIPSGINIVGAGGGRTEGTPQTLVRINSFYNMLDFPQLGPNKPPCASATDVTRYSYDPSPRRYVIQMDGVYQRMAGFAIDGQDKKCHGGIFLRSGTGVVFDDLKITNFRYSGLIMGKTTDVEVKNCYFKNNAFGNNLQSKGNLMFWGATNLSIHDCYIEETYVQLRNAQNVPLGAYGIKIDDPAQTAYCGGIGATDSRTETISSFKLYNTTINVLPNGAYNNGGPPAISFEVIGNSAYDSEIYNCTVNNHLSLVATYLVPPGKPDVKRAVRVHDNYFNMVGRYAYGIEANVPNLEVDHNFFNEGYYPINQYEAGRVYENHLIHHNVFYAPQGRQDFISYQRYPNGFKFYNNTLIDTKGVTDFIKQRSNNVSTGMEIKNNIFISTVGKRGTMFVPGGITNPVVEKNLYYNLNPFTFDPKAIVVDSTKAATTILNLTGDKPKPFFELAEGSPAANIGVEIPGISDGFKGPAPDLGAYESDQTAVPPTTFLKVLQQDADGGQTTNNQLKPTLQLTNEGNAPAPYGELTLRYWFTAENFAPINTYIDYALLGTGKVQTRYVRLQQPRQGADGYIEYSFDASAGGVAASGNSGPIQTRIAKQNWTDFNESDDYSYRASPALTLNNRITIYRNGTLIWGVEPGAVTATTKLVVQSENKNTVTNSNTISTYLKINNEGNTPVSYKDVSVRYWFTAEGAQPLNYWIDYAELGNTKVRGRFDALATPRNGADTYFEMTLDSTLGSLQPQSSTGNIQYRLAKQDWSAFNEADDHSYKPAAPMANNDRITVYYKGALVYGTEPVSGGRRAAPESAAEKLQFLAFPNPATTEIIVRLGSSTAPVELTFYTPGGQVVHQQQTRLNTPVLVSQLPAGLYLLRAQTDRQVQYLKLLKQ